MIEANKDVTLNETVERLAAERSVCIVAAPSAPGSAGGAGRSKKSAHALEQDRPDLLKRRQDWFEAQLDLDPARLVFIDETALSPGWPACAVARHAASAAAPAGRIGMR